jgi:hypothetical protein
MVKAGSLSFVLQGPVADEAQGVFVAETVRLLRQHFLGCEIVLASWKGQEQPGLDVDRALYLDDPGDLEAQARPWNRFRFRNRNTKRMLVSTMAGLDAATTEYCVKLRTDSRLTGTQLLAKIERDGDVGREKVGSTWPRGGLASRILVTDIFSRDPRRSGLFCHLSDIFLCGRRSDLRLLFSKALEMLANHEANGDVPWLCPEQFLWAPTLCGSDHGELAHAFDCPPARARAYESAALASAEILNAEEIGLCFSKQFGTSRRNCYQPGDFQRYRRDAMERPFRYNLELILRSSLMSYVSRLKLLKLGVAHRLARLLGSAKTGQAV